ncbi:GIY-YIG nuclease family protein [Bifidobacterium vespertilionis]|uniref:GIY-YIG nuclease family protein n=1 Tax=Bifidobacterium vespertilionis TaxID=2562524 RepID=UPI001BDD4ACD|nr:GIY-YIG nuclease family protein [Bifidobacterium vespertilionis]MBT1180210.1 GIY-YIG nuclease family protein [Bifidobacterium vespertilionis]
MMTVYMLTNRHNTVLYIGVTNNIIRRMHEHRNHTADGFTARYNVSKLVYMETAPDPVAAIAREKQLKGWTRAKKNALIEAANPEWRDLWPDLAGELSDFPSS